MPVISNDRFMEFSNMLDLKISRAVYGYHHSYSGSNRMHFNRIFMICDKAAESGSYVRHFDGSKTVSKIVLRPGRIIFMPADIDLEFNFTHDLHMVAFHFSLEIFSGHDVFSGRKRCGFKDGQHETAEEALKLIQGKTGLRETLKLQRIILESALFFYRGGFDVPAAFLLRECYSALTDYITRKLNAGLTVAELAEAFNMNRDVLSKKFASDFGIPLKRFISTQLANSAANLLTETSDSISEIAEKLGFSDQYYFSRFFSKHKGISPAKFRKNILRMLK